MAHQDGDGGRQTDAVDRGNQIEPLRQVGVLADRRFQPLQLGPLHRLKSCDLRLPMLTDARVAAALAAVLQDGNVLAQLVEHRQMLGRG